jgi:hypothetical protein
VPAQRPKRVAALREGSRAPSVKLLVFILISSAACDLAWAEDVPLPRAKPASAAANHSASPASPENLRLHNPKAGPSDCAVRLAEIAQFAHEATVNGPGQCGGADLVRLQRILMPNGASAAVVPPATLRCPMAEAIAKWVRDDLGPAMAELGSSLTALTNGGSYGCRGRNNNPRAKTSEHGRGNALDLGPITLTNGAVADVSDGSLPSSSRLRLRDSACYRFNTVLGPGSDDYHANHIHLDLAQRARGYRICQWDVVPQNAPAE